LTTRWTVQTIKTWHGRKWAILDENRNVVLLNNAVGVAVFPYTKEGLAMARETLAELKRGDRK
jgi:hypothetical protein